MPPNTVYVGRPTKYGNPFTVDEYGPAALSNFKGRVQGLVLINPDVLRELRGKDLACWCKEGAPCHADILLEMANPEPIICSACQRGDYCPHGTPRCSACGAEQEDNGMIAWCKNGHVARIAKDDPRYSET